ncbi:MAG TPA: 4Fe-4S dicluster domain-containing protein [Alphaproteobacteria bacterium]|nr:4Fe-4S dicluster domain-containing protein [Alphaproteobacteria bacterium]
MEINGKRLLVCDCNATMPLDAKGVARACGGDALDVHTLLCRTQLDALEKALGGGRPLLVACTQEAPLFAEARAEAGVDVDLRFTNIRERAGWSEEADHATPKIAALLAEAALDLAPTPTVSLKSTGVTLIYGRDEKAIAAARRLADRLECTVLLSEPGDIVPPRLTEVPIYRGTIIAARGYLGAFEIEVNRYAAAIPSSRGRLEFEAARDSAASRCDLILDLSGGAPLFQAHAKRDGYFRPDPGDPAAIERALFDIVDMVGEYEKPRYVKYDATICVHSRSRKTGCTRCLDVCPTGAIVSAGDHVAIDPYICAGCGSCASVCPTGAATYDLPPQTSLYDRLRTLLGAYSRAGGMRAMLLVHDGRHGEELISMIAHHGRGLPARVVPFAVNEVTQLGFDFFMVALAYGAAQLRLLVDPRKRSEITGLAAQIGLAEAALSGLGYGEGRVAAIDTADPEIVEATLYAASRDAAPKPGAFLPMGGRRAVTLLALRHLHSVAPAPVDVLPLAPGSSFGALDVNVAGCTLCLACVGACPTGALIDNPDRPMLRFIEDACVQCGLCKATCPEKVIQLRPRFNFNDDARSPALVKEEEPAQCIRCGKPFAARAAIERVVEKLSGKHWMYMQGGALDRIRMCDECRMIVQSETAIDPFAGPPRPPIRTTDEELRLRDLARAQAAGKPPEGNA